MIPDFRLLGLFAFFKTMIGKAVMFLVPFRVISRDRQTVTMRVTLPALGGLNLLLGDQRGRSVHGLA